jgi:long-chain acyl-CoA synthetase
MKKMAPSRLIDFLGRIAQLDAEFIVYDDGYRGWTYRFEDVAKAAHALRVRLRAQGVRKGDVAMIWSESRPGWVAALWGCLLEGVALAPVDPQSSIRLFRRIEEKVRPAVILVGERVPAVEGSRAPVWRLPDIEKDRNHAPLAPVTLTGDDVAEIVFTSGTTTEPKGVVIAHGNLLANVKPVEAEIAKYRKYARPFLPLRILNLLPLSHLFGQSLSLFLPPLVPASVVFISGTGAQEVVRQIHNRRVSALVAVPKVLEVLRDFVVHRYPEAADPRRARGRWPMRWWRFRRVHRLLGWKFWCFIAGGAPLPAELEQFWSRLGFLVVQGYGLTETAPIVSLSHPFHVRRGTVGKPLGGVEVKIAADGEVLVRGENVTRGYFQSPGETAAAIEDGWLHTGDIGELDAEGHLVIRGRKKEMIVTPEGLKVFPEDVETVLNQMEGVRESAVVGRDRVHAVLVLGEGADAGAIVREANQKLEEHQKIRSVTVWMDGELPRTRSTRKLRRAEIADWVAKGARESGAKTETGLAELLRKYAPGRAITGETTLDELGLSSLDRVELMMDLEQRLDASIDEAAFASVRTIADLARPMAPAEETPLPTYNRTRVARMIRRIALPGVLLPLTRIFAHIKVSGAGNLERLRGPVIFAANHQSHMDVPAILASLPARWRYRIAPAMSKGFFDAHFHPERHGWRRRWINSLQYRLATLMFNAFPIPQTEAGTRQSIRYMGELADEGWSILIFPEGDRTEHGEIRRFRPGVGMMASHLRLPVVPVRLKGLERVLHRSAKWAHPGPVEVKFGEPMLLQGESHAALAQQVEDAVRGL